MVKGYKKPLTFEDLYDLPTRDKTAQVHPIFEREWTKAQQRWCFIRHDQLQKKNCSSLQAHVELYKVVRFSEIIVYIFEIHLHDIFTQKSRPHDEFIQVETCVGAYASYVDWFAGGHYVQSRRPVYGAG